MSNSKLVTRTKISPNNSGARMQPISRITPHCVVGQLSCKNILEWFAQEKSKSSCNYCIGYDGEIGLCVPENMRAWTSSNRDNDQRAVTIECASDSATPFWMNDTVYGTLVDLCVDICRRNGKTHLIWISDKDTALNHTMLSDEMLLTVHRWFANKSCPGDWLYKRLDNVADRVTTALLNDSFTVKVLIDDLNIRTEPSMSGDVVGVTGKGTFTIVSTSGSWGKLKSGAGWIYIGNSNYVSI